MNLSCCAEWFGITQTDKISTVSPHRKNREDSCWILSLHLSKCCTCCHLWGDKFSDPAVSLAVPFQPGKGGVCVGVPTGNQEIWRDFILFPQVTAWALLVQFMLFLQQLCCLSGRAQSPDMGSAYRYRDLMLPHNTHSLINASSEMLKCAVGAQPHSFLRKLLSWVLGKLLAALQGKAFIAIPAFPT